MASNETNEDSKETKKDSGKRKRGWVEFNINTDSRRSESSFLGASRRGTLSKETRMRCLRSASDLHYARTGKRIKINDHNMTQGVKELEFEEEEGNTVTGQPARPPDAPPPDSPGLQPQCLSGPLWSIQTETDPNPYNIPPGETFLEESTFLAECARQGLFPPSVTRHDTGQSENPLEERLGSLQALDESMGLPSSSSELMATQNAMHEQRVFQQAFQDWSPHHLEAPDMGPQPLDELMGLTSSSSELTATQNARHGQRVFQQALQDWSPHHLEAPDMGPQPLDELMGLTSSSSELTATQNARHEQRVFQQALQDWSPHHLEAPDMEPQPLSPESENSAGESLAKSQLSQGCAEDLQVGLQDHQINPPLNSPAFVSQEAGENEETADAALVNNFWDHWTLGTLDPELYGINPFLSPSRILRRGREIEELLSLAVIDRAEPQEGTSNQMDEQIQDSEWTSDEMDGQIEISDEEMRRYFNFSPEPEPEP